MRFLVSITFVGALLASLSLGCGRHNKHAETTVRTRAAFDFPCDPNEIQLTIIDRTGSRKLSTQIGAEGCGKKAVYVYLSSTNTWILNTESGAQAVTQEKANEKAVDEAEQLDQ